MNKMTLTHLSNITAYDDISCPSKAIKRGMHCPLFGCILLTKYIADMPFLIVGTDECGFYGREIIKVVADDPLSYDTRRKAAFKHCTRSLTTACFIGVLRALRAVGIFF